jgi:hypothetical protein
MSLQSLTDQVIAARAQTYWCTSSSLPRTRCVTATFHAHLVAARITATAAQRIAASEAADPSAPTTAVSDLNDIPSSFEPHPRLPIQSHPGAGAHGRRCDRTQRSRASGVAANTIG